MTKPTRRLSAIVFTDMVGYTAKMANDETAAMRFLKIHDDMIRAEIAATTGRIVKTIGDSFMIEFSSAVEAVECMAAIQARFAEYNKSVEPSEQILIRVGIHIGDVVAMEDGDLIGDGVNIAARLQPLAKPGGICVSRAVYDAVHASEKSRRTTWKSVGPKHLKGVDGTVDVFETGVEVGGGGISPGRETRSRSHKIEWVIAAVLIVLISLLVFNRTHSSRPSVSSISSPESDQGSWELMFQDDFAGDTLSNEWITQGWGGRHFKHGLVFDGMGWMYLKQAAIDGLKMEVDVALNSDTDGVLNLLLNVDLENEAHYCALFGHGNSSEPSRTIAWLFKKNIIPGSLKDVTSKRSYKLAAQYLNGAITLSVDGDEVSRYRDPIPTAGIENSRCGLIVWSYGTVTISNIKVYRRARPLQTSLDMAIRMMEKGQYQTAVPIFDEILSTGKDRPVSERKQVQYYKGVCLFLKGDRDSTVREFEKVIQEYPYDEYLNSEAEYFLVRFMQDNSKRLERINQYILKYPASDRVVQLKLAAADHYLYNEKNPAEAARWLETQFADVIENKTVLDANEQFRPPLKYFNESLNAYGACGSLFLAAGDTAAAVKIYRKILYKNSMDFGRLREAIRWIEGDTAFTREYARAEIRGGSVAVDYDIRRSTTLFYEKYRTPLQIKYGINDWREIKEKQMQEQGGVWHAALDYVPDTTRYIDFVFMDADGREIDKNGGLNFRAYLKR